MANMPRVGECFASRYEILDITANGGQAYLVKVRDIHTGAILALKLLSADPNAPGYATQLARFHREGQTRINHPNAVNPIELGEDSGQWYITFPFVEGQTITQLLRSCGGKLPVDDAVAIVVGIADVLEAAHAKRIVHRDIKPENILFQSDGIARLVDFGIGRHATDLTLTKSGDLLGTILFISPEQLRDANTVDGRSDLYSLGGGFYLMLTGDLPVQGTTTEEVLKSVFQYVPPPPNQLVPSIPQHVSDACMRLLAKDPAHRFQTAGQFIQAVNGSPGQSRYCASCGLPAAKDSIFCGGCGACQDRSLLPGQLCLACGAVVRDDPACPSCQRPFGATDHHLDFTGGPLAGCSFRIPQGQYCVGRDQLSSRDPYVSRRHLNIDCQDGVVSVQDAGSKNGMNVDGSPAVQSVRLTPNRSIAIAGNTAVYKT